MLQLLKCSPGLNWYVVEIESKILAYEVIITPDQYRGNDNYKDGIMWQLTLMTLEDLQKQITGSGKLIAHL